MRDDRRKKRVGDGGGKRKMEPTEEQLYTGKKKPELAVFYNIAFFRMAGLLNHLIGNDYDGSKDKLEDVFVSWLKGAETGTDEHLPEAAYSRLRNYLWKGYFLEKNTSGYAITEDDRRYVREMLRVLFNVRNFHSHGWHDNRALICSPQLSTFIEELHGLAVMAQSKEMATEIARYLGSYIDSRGNGRPSRDKVMFFYKANEYDHYLTLEGRIFFLSFFLTRGEMARFLQQSKGSKRNDKPEFKIKHLIHRHYTHRDGASRNFYGFEENVLESLPEDERKEVIAIRQAYKVISYLNDVPVESVNTELHPLIRDGGTAVENAEEIIAWCNEHKVLDDVVMTVAERTREVVKRHKGKDGRKREKVVVELENVIEMRCADWPDHHFRMGRTGLHKALLDMLRTGDGGAHLKKKLSEFVEERKHLLELVNNPDKVKPEKERFTLNSELDEYYRYRLRGGDALKKRMGVWLQNYGNAGGKNYKSSILNFKKAIEELPIEVRYHDLWFGEEERKPRRGDRFAEFAVHYLMDMERTPGWEWMFEQFEGELQMKEETHYGEQRTVQKNVLIRKKTFSEQLPSSKHRLSLRQTIRYW